MVLGFTGTQKGEERARRDKGPVIVHFMVNVAMVPSYSVKCYFGCPGESVLG